jgi:hypothetical protein
MSAPVDELRAELLNPEPDPYFMLTGGVQEWLVNNWKLRERAAAELTTLQSRLEAVKAERDAQVLAFAEAVLHGDNEHRDWLLAAAKAFVAGGPVPPPNGKGRAEAAEARVEELQKALAEAINEAETKGRDLRNDDATRRGAIYAAQLIRALSPARTEPDLSKGGEE